METPAGSCTLEVFPWWSPSGKLTFALLWQNALPPPNHCMGSAKKKWHIKVWAPQLPCVLPIRQFPGHSGQGQATIPPVLGTGHHPAVFLPSSPARWLTVCYLYYWESWLVNVGLQGLGEDSDFFRSLPVNSWDLMNLTCCSQGTGESHKSSPALLCVV